MNADLTPYGIGNKGLTTILPENFIVRETTAEPLKNLRSAALQAGFSIQIESAYRSFERQLSIWNRKAAGELPLLDAAGNLRARPQNEKEMVEAILTWSALPGASRHHFGTEVDVSDAFAIPEGYQVQLTPEECSGMFAPFHRWLSAQIENETAFGFARVFVPGRGKIQPEEWHLSHLPGAREMQKKIDPQALREIYETTEIFGKDYLIRNLNQLMDDYVYPYFV
ncbi:MAG: M15 family metallopeptidase [Fibrobacter sp.]|nr:M15 family metallopeptidase [Fibrobacter sp.]